MNINDWWLSLDQGRRDVLIEDKWMLANAAFDAGLKVGIESSKPLALIVKNVFGYNVMCDKYGNSGYLSTLEDAQDWATEHGYRLK